jgi:hypothetical protein
MITRFRLAFATPFPRHFADAIAAISIISDYFITQILPLSRHDFRRR